MMSSLQLTAYCNRTSGLGLKKQFFSCQITTVKIPTPDLRETVYWAKKSEFCWSDISVTRYCTKIFVKYRKFDLSLSESSFGMIFPGPGFGVSLYY